MLRISKCTLLTGTLLVLASGCGGSPDGDAQPLAGTDFSGGGRPSDLVAACDPDNGGINLPRGFCAIVVTDDLPGARHLAIAPNGDIIVARRNLGPEPSQRGGITVLRDADGDGRADERRSWGTNGGNDVLLAGDYAYHATDDAVLRYRLPPGAMEPAGDPDSIVVGLPDTANHAAKSIALGGDGTLFVSVGAPGNACMANPRMPGSPGLDPCPLLETTGGIWAFDGAATGQTQRDGVRYATGLRNVMALAVQPATGDLYAAMHGRDLLHFLWPDLYDTEESAENPAEEFFPIIQGADYGWPYCYHDTRADAKVLAPEYGGDRETVGRCEDMEAATIAFPAHWAPNDLEFYTSDHFPRYFHGGAFIAFHGSWNRAPLPQEGYHVVFIPAEGDSLTTDWVVFADGFLREGILQRTRTYRPVGVATGPDGSLYIADSAQGVIWRVIYAGM